MYARSPMTFENKLWTHISGPSKGFHPTALHSEKGEWKPLQNIYWMHFTFATVKRDERQRGLLFQMAIYMVTFDNPIKILSVHIFYCKKSSKTIFLLARIIVLKKNLGWFLVYLGTRQFIFAKLFSKKTLKNWVKY